MLKGRKHSGHVLLVAEGRLTLQLAGHAIDLAEVLTLEGSRIELDTRAFLNGLTARWVQVALKNPQDKEESALPNGSRKKSLEARELFSRRWPTRNVSAYLV